MTTLYRRMGTVAAAATGVAVLAVAAQGSTNRAVAATRTPLYPSATAPFAVGISPGSDMLSETPAQVASTMAAIAGSGDRWLRVDVDWAAVQASQNSWNWAAEDTVIRDAVNDGLTVDAILDYAPAWALANGQPSPSAFSTFASTAVRRYAPLGVHVFEVWNEENLGWAWNNAVSVTSYGKLLQAGYRAIHGADAHAVVLLGGLGRGPDMDTNLAVDPYDYLAGLYADGYGRYFDAVNVHPYSAPEAPLTSDFYNNPFSALPQYYALMQSYGDAAKKIWVTEYGYPTANSSDAVTEQQQSDYLTSAIESIMGQSWAGPFFVYNWQNDANQSFGLLRADGSAKPAYSVFEESPH